MESGVDVPIMETFLESTTSGLAPHQPHPQFIRSYLDWSIMVERKLGIHWSMARWARIGECPQCWLLIPSQALGQRESGVQSYELEVCGLEFLV